MKKRYPKILVPLGILILHLPLIVSAQEETDISEEDIYELSPFVVDSSDDSDYRAQNTLAGTRIKSNLNDVSASLSVMTDVFMEDLGATDMQDAMAYSVNVENENEFVGDDQEGFANADTTTTRVRGLVGAATSSNFFNTNVKSDTYNINRITIARGANSILFGIGSPSGALDSTPTRAMIVDEVSFSHRTDNNGTQRFVLDLNKAINDDFAVRLVGLNQDKRSFIDPEFDDEQRVYFTSFYNPFKSTKLRFSYENVTNNRVRGRRIMAKDGISDWIAAGKPLYDNKNGQWVDSSGNPTDVSAYNFQSAVPGTRYIFSNGNTTEQSAELPFGNQVQPGGMTSISGNSEISSFTDEDLLPSDINIYGEANWADIQAQIYNFTWEQQLGQSLFLEMAYNREKWENISREHIRPGIQNSAVQADVNMYLVDNDGIVTDTLNPNLGRFYTESYLIGFDREKDMETYRATLSYELDLTNHSGWLGKHNFSALYQNETVDDTHIKLRAKNVIGSETDPGGIAYDGNGIDIVNRAYIDIPGMSDNSGKSSADKWVSPKENGLHYWDLSYGSNHETPIHEFNETKSSMAVIQSFFDLTSNKNDQLVVTYGLRSDKLKSKEAQLTGLSRDENGLYEWGNVPVDSLRLSESGTTSTLGLVYHTPLKGISLSYNNSDNFTPQAAWRDYNNKARSARTGTTNEWGISYETLNKKFFAKLVYFDAEANNEVEQDWFYWSANWYVIAMMEWQIDDWVNTIYADRGIDRTADLAPAAADNQYWYWDVGSMRPVRDRKTDGFEFEMFYQPTKNWNIRLTAAKTESVDSNIAPGMIAYIDERWDVWERYKGLTQPGLITGSSDPSIQSGMYDDAMAFAEYMWDPQSDLYSNYYSVAYGPWWVPVYTNSEALPRVELLKSLEGQPTQRSRKYRVNLTSNYDFTEGKLTGLSVGGGMRYRSKAAIGNEGMVSTNPVLPAGTIVADVSKPIYGDAILEFDMWVGYNKMLKLGGTEVDWSVNLNIYNMFSDGGLEAAQVNFDGSTKSTMIKQPRVISLTNTIRF